MGTKVRRELVNPKSIVVVGASNDTSKPGGAILRNIKEGGFRGDIYVVNPKEETIQGIKCCKNVQELPCVELAVICIAAKFTEETIKVLTQQKNTKAFIIISAGFGEESHEGKELEKRIVDMIEQTGGCLIGPNCTGIFTPYHHAIFSKPFPKSSPKGVDFITGSGATGCFIMDIGMQQGLHFNHCWAVGNSAQLGIEDILEYHDESFDPKTSSKVILMYIENIKNPQKLLKHARSLRLKGCKIAAIKSGSSEAGSRAASSHTGALASPDVAVDALFKKAGIVRCYGREELCTVGNIFTYPHFEGKNIAIITHAGGPAVMLTDALSKAGLNIPHIEGETANELLGKLFAGSSVGNPIDFLATGTPEQLGTIIDYCDNTPVKPHDINSALEALGTTPLREGCKITDLIARPQLTMANLSEILPGLKQTLESLPNRKEEITEAAEIKMKYKGYIERERMVADKMHRLENIKIRGHFKYSEMQQLSTEARQKLEKIDPETLAQASRIPGVSPSDINIMLVLMKR